MSNNSLYIDFLKQNNIQLLWEVILDHESMVNKNRQELEEINNLFQQSISQFYEKERNNQNQPQNINLMSINKKYISMFINNISTTNTNTNTNTNKPLITHEEIQENRMTQFEKEYANKQRDFTSSMTLPVPPTPNFSDKKDAPIDEMDIIMQRTIEQRKLEFEQFQNLSNKNHMQVENWLKPAETSIKVEKINNNIKYIKISNDNIDNNIIKSDIIDLTKNNEERKHISWGENKIYDLHGHDGISLNNKNESKYETNNESNNENKKIDNIFNKFKVIKNENENEKNFEYQNKINNDFVNNNNDIINNFHNDINCLNNKLDNLQEQFKKQSNTLESYIEKINNTLSILYNIISKKEKQNETEYHANNNI
jgi:hypothetical protein